MVLQEGGDALYVGLLSCGNVALTLVEVNVALQVVLGVGNGLNDSGLSLTSLESSLEVSDALVLAGDGLVAISNHTASLVDGSVQAINLCLVVSATEGEAVSAIAVLEVVGAAGEDLNLGSTSSHSQLSVDKVVNDGRLESNGPSFFLTEVEVEVGTKLEDEVVAVVVSTGDEGVAPTGTAYSLDFEQTGSTLITAEEVHQVNGVVQSEHSVVNGKAAVVEAGPSCLVAGACSVNHTGVLQLQTEDGGQLLTHVNAESAAGVFPEGMADSRRGNAALDAEIPVVKELAFLVEVLCRSAHCYKSQSNYRKKLFHTFYFFS